MRVCRILKRSATAALAAALVILSAPAAAERQVIDSSGDVFSNSNATNHGVSFTADGTLTLTGPFGSDSAQLGATDGVSAITNGGNSPQGRIFGSKPSLIFTGRLGGANANDQLYELNSSGVAVFKSVANTTNLLRDINLERITSADGVATAITATFNGGIGAAALVFNNPLNAATLNFAAATTTDSTDAFYHMNVIVRPASTRCSRSISCGTLRFNNNRPANLRGNIGTAERKVKGLIINAPASGAAARTVRILGNIYTEDGIALNGNTLVLGNGTDSSGNVIPIFGARPTGTQPNYTISGPITTNTDNTGILNIRDFDFTFKDRIGTAGGSSLSVADRRELAAVNIENARATFDRAINARAVTVKAGTLAVGDTGGDGGDGPGGAPEPLSITGTLNLEGNATQGAILELGDKQLNVDGNLTIGKSAAGRPHILSVTVRKERGGTDTTTGAFTTSGKLQANGGLTLDTDVTLADLTARVRVNDNPAAPIGIGDRFTILENTAALPAALARGGRVVRSVDPAGAFAFRLSRGDTDNRDLILTTLRARRVIGENWALDSYGEANGVAFGRENLTLSVADGQNIGQTGASVSLDTNGVAAARGTVRFAGASEVAGRVGGVLTNSSEAFLATPAGLINRLEINSANTVTFNGGVGANTLHFTTNGTAALNGSASGSGDIFHRMNVTTTTDGEGMLRFGNARDVNFLGNSGTPDFRLNSLSIDAPAAGAAPRTVRFKGNLYYASGIALNGNNLTLGNGMTNVFGAPDRATAYTVFAPITTAPGGTGRLRIKDFNFNLSGGNIGAPAARLAEIDLNNTTVNMQGAVYANRVNLSNATATINNLYTSALNLNTNASLTVSGDLTLNGNAALSLGTNTLNVTGNMALAAANSLSVTLGGSASGRLQARRVSAPANSILTIRATIANANRLNDGQTFRVVQSNSALPAARLRLNVSGGTDDFEFMLARSASNRVLLLTARRLATFAELTKDTPFEETGGLLNRLSKDRDASAPLKAALRSLQREVGKRPRADRPAAMIAAVAELTPAAAAAEQTSVSILSRSLDMVTARLSSLRAGAGGPALTARSGGALQLAALGFGATGWRGLSSGAAAGRAGFWARPFGNWEKQDQRGGRDGYKADIAGLALGADRAVSDVLRLGAAFAYARANVNGAGRGRGDNADLANLQALIYGAWDARETPWFVDAAMTFAQTRYEAAREIDIAPVRRRARASYASYQAGLRLGTGYEFALGRGLTLSPRAEADYSFLYRDDYTETGAGAFNLRVEGRRSHRLTTGLGAALRAEIRRDQLTLVPEASVMWLRDWGARDSRTVAGFAGDLGAGRFSTRAAAPGRNAARLGLGLDVWSDSGWQVSARYDGEFRSGRRWHGVSLNLQWAF